MKKREKRKQNKNKRRFDVERKENAMENYEKRMVTKKGKKEKV